jgi:hypothetical protein
MSERSCPLFESCVVVRIVIVGVSVAGEGCRRAGSGHLGYGLFFFLHGSGDFPIE